MRGVNAFVVWIPILLALVFLVGLMSGPQMLGGRNRGIERRLTEIDRRLQLVMDHLGVTEPEPEAVDVVAHLVAGNKIQAIKIYRERTGVGLKEAKDAVEDIARRHGITGR
ncbi:hypothetical protein Vau01_085770 [Virgisporangium aurantiacum]|uniref:Large ribosomal subunit protein bL12 C-terminal domain-containing protein n=1 Tax=Virgisporangium aurantiacum TaxID=175570 RepID=A0A8J4E4C1_9ACTN|nr:hypothetical protein Vau01_085770 [Virgisporangium aurantiacum]